MEHTAKELVELEALLHKRRYELDSIADASAQAAETVELDQTRVGRLSRMDALQGQAMAQESERRRRFEVQRVVSALSRLEQDDYGYCLSCGELISLLRLRADPCATQCIACASARE